MYSNCDHATSANVVLTFQHASKIRGSWLSIHKPTQNQAEREQVLQSANVQPHTKILLCLGITCPLVVKCSIIPWALS